MSARAATATSPWKASSVKDALTDEVSPLIATNDRSGHGQLMIACVKRHMIFTVLASDLSDIKPQTDVSYRIDNGEVRKIIGITFHEGLRIGSPYSFEEGLKAPTDEFMTALQAVILRQGLTAGDQHRLRVRTETLSGTRLDFDFDVSGAKARIEPFYKACEAKEDPERSTTALPNQSRAG